MVIITKELHNSIIMAGMSNSNLTIIILDKMTRTHLEAALETLIDNQGNVSIFITNYLFDYLLEINLTLN